MIAETGAEQNGQPPWRSAPATFPPRQRAWLDEVRAFELKLTEDQVITLAASVLRKVVDSLDSLTAAERGRVFHAMQNLKRPALD